jgi:RNA recognition motif-containing protein
MFALTNIFLNPLIPLLISFDGSATPIDQHTLKMHPNRNQYNIEIPHHRSIDDKNSLNLHSKDINYDCKHLNQNDVEYLMQGYFLAEINFEYLEESYPKIKGI